MTGSRLTALLLAFPFAWGSLASAEPLDLGNATPRWVDVAFEVSPRDLPTQTDSVYTDPVPARVEAGDTPDRIVVRIDRRYVEGILFAADEPVSGSFSDFVWVFDASTGEVVSASVSGALNQRLDWGFFHTRAHADVASEMASERVVGIEEPREWLGRELFRFCDDPSRRGCRPVAGRGYDPATGYVHAVGPLSVRVSEVTVETYSPLGEAIFSERHSPELARSAEGMGGSDAAAPIAAAAAVAQEPLEAQAIPAVSAGPLSEP